MDAEDVQRQAAATNRLLGEIGLGTPGHSAWWNVVVAELCGRTPTQAWLAGDQDAVRSLVAEWYEASAEGQRRVAQDPALMLSLRRRVADLDRLYPAASSSVPHLA